MNVNTGDYVELDWNVPFAGPINTSGTSINAVKMDGDGSDPTSTASITAVRMDANKNMYVLGRFQGPVRMGGGVTITNKRSLPQAFLAKYDPSFNLVWVRTFQATGTPDPTSPDTKVNPVNLTLTPSFVFVAVTWSGFLNLNTGQANTRFVDGGAVGGWVLVKLNLTTGAYVDHLPAKSASTTAIQTTGGLCTVPTDGSFWVNGGATGFTGFLGTSGPAPMQVKFTDRSLSTDSGSNPITSWAWDFGDGNTSTAQSPTHTYIANGTYIVTLTITRAGGSNPRHTASKTYSVVVGGTGLLPDFTFSPKVVPAQLEIPVTVQFTDLSAGGPTTWDWDFGDGSAHSSAQNPSHTYTVVGQYTVVLTTGTAVHKESIYIGQFDGLYNNDLLAEFTVTPYQINNAGSIGGFLVKIDSVTFRPPFAPIHWECTSSAQGLSVDYDPITGGVVMTGTFNGTFDFSFGAGTGVLTSQGSFDMVVAKYGPTGGFVWAKGWGSSISLFGNSVSVNTAGKVLVVGNFTGVSSYGGPNPPLSTRDSNDGFYYSWIMFNVYNQDGTSFSSDNIGFGEGGVGGCGVWDNSNVGRFFICGTSPTAIFNQAYGGTHVWAGSYMSTTSSATLRWGNLYNGTGDPNNSGNAIAIDPSGIVVAFGGTFLPTIDLKSNAGVLTDSNPANPAGFLATINP